MGLESSNREMETSDMRRTERNLDRCYGGKLLGAAVVVVLLAGSIPIPCAAQQTGQKTFSSPEEASKALVTATENNDEKALLEIFGPEGKQIVSSGDEVEDTQSRANFARRYQEMHRLVKELDGTITLYIGAKNWPTPIPIVNKGNVWYFDTEAGKQEILSRRIGRNELSAIRICQELVAAEKEYSASHGNEYAQKLFSDEGQHNGLYWKAAEGTPESPIGPLVAWADAEAAARSRDGQSAPYRGYYFKILTRQGKNGPRGAKSYVVNGKMTEGFAFAAYPAEYRSSGVMTFLVDQDGIVYEKDLGKKTAGLAKSLTEYNPNSSWAKTEEEPEQSASGPATK